MVQPIVNTWNDEFFTQGSRNIFVACNPRVAERLSKRWCHAVRVFVPVRMEHGSGIAIEVVQVKSQALPIIAFDSSRVLSAPIQTIDELRDEYWNVKEEVYDLIISVVENDKQELVYNTLKNRNGPCSSGVIPNE